MNLDIPDIPQGEIFVGFSGGVDSTALLWYLCVHFGNRVTALHFNHGWSNSEQFQMHAEKFCAKNKIKIITGKGVKKMKCTETNARDMRFAWFDAIVNGNLFLAHNKGDQVENILLQIARGSMNPMIKTTSNRGDGKKGYTIYRPMLEIEKQQANEYCLQNQLKWIEDDSNFDVKIPRNKIRHQVIPLMQSINSAFGEHLISYAKSKDETSLTKQEYKQLAYSETLSCKSLEDASNLTVCEVIRDWLLFHKVKDINKCHITHIKEVLRGGKSAHTLSEGRIVRRKNNIVYFLTPTQL